MCRDPADAVVGQVDDIRCCSTTGAWSCRPACASRLPISNAPGSVPRKVLNLPVVLRRRDTYSVTVQNTVEIPQMQFLDKLMTKRLVPGRDGADNCGGSAVAWSPCRDSADAVLGQI